MNPREWKTRKQIKREEICSKEKQDQQQVIKWLQWHGIPHFAVPNGFKRTPIQGAIERSLGLRAGVPDLIIPVAAKGYHAMALEVKRIKGGRVSEAQQYWLEQLTKQGWYAQVGKGYDECIFLLQFYLGIK